MSSKFIRTIDEIPKKANISIYGAGGAGLFLKKNLEEKRKDVKILSFIDSFKNGNLDGLPIQKFNESIQFMADRIIVVSSFWWRDIENILKKYGLDNYLIEAFNLSDLCVEAITYFPNDISMESLSTIDKKSVSKFEYFLKKEKPETILEIGTNTGVSAVFMAMHAKKVITLDINAFKVKDRIWKHFDVSDRVEFILVRNNEEKKEIVDSLEFNFAFIDGDHTYDGVKFDFDITKRCGKVLFHDYDYWKHSGGENHKDIKKFVDTLPNLYENSVLELRNPFAFWKIL